ncbi:hypothetical protein BJ742DRAFT_703929 [Cladochytrium replicatum]|nr:hypothetical protein BJ742DRAFT_703929 [Cladochytrium replicatum]
MRITHSLIEKSALTLRKKRNESTEEFLARIEHLSLICKEITSIDNLDLCLNLTVLSLPDNKISTIENMHQCPNLDKLFLQNNLIADISGLDGLWKLRVLHLGSNRIKRVSGQPHLPSLEELHLDNQLYQAKSPALEFEEEAITSLATNSRLVILTCSHNRITSVEAFKRLVTLAQLDLSFNDVTDCNEVEGLLRAIPRMENLNLADNPVEKTLKFRQRLLLVGDSLVCLNRKEATLAEKANLRVLARRKVRPKLTETPKEKPPPEPKPIPHLPPFATQYRDLLLQQISEVNRNNSELRRTGSDVFLL